MVGSGSTGGECKLAQKDRKTKKEWKRCDMGSNAIWQRKRGGTSNYLTRNQLSGKKWA